MAKYSRTSPYLNTPQNDINLEPLVIRTFDIEDDDQVYTIERTYAYRPDLLAFDLYGNAKLWWVFAVRNPDIIVDPVVVIPDILSKKAFTKENSAFDNQNGSDPKIAILIQDSAVNKNAC